MPEAGRRPLISEILKSRVVHFAVLGSLIFAIAPREVDPSKIVVSQQDLRALHESEAQRLHRGSVTGNLAADVDRHAIEDEILYREALRLGLDRGDNTVRQHLIVKSLLFAEDLAGASRAPTDDDLRAYFEANRARWTIGASVHFIHVFSTHHDELVALGPQIIDAEKKSPGVPPALGDAFPASRDVVADQNTLAAIYGEPFAQAVFDAPVGSWTEPLDSKFGFSTVKVIAHTAGRPAAFEEVKQKLVLDWTVDQRHKAVDAFIDHAYARYQIVVDGERLTDLKSTGRLGRRPDPSAED